MVEAIKQYKDHISTGFHTTVMLMNELTRNGYSPVAYKLIDTRTIPSWGYTIENGATTIWERWDGFVKGRGFQDPGMNSFCHYAIGSVGEWMYRAILGINPDDKQPGYGHFIVRPQVGGVNVAWGRGSYDSIRGTIAVDWNIDDEKFRLLLTVPANTTATVYVPAIDAAKVTESGKPASDAAGVKLLRTEGETAVYEVASGRYDFGSSWRAAQ
jgi:alpha-L-rhamnosidase